MVSLTGELRSIVGRDFSDSENDKHSFFFALGLYGLKIGAAFHNGVLNKEFARGLSVR